MGSVNNVLNDLKEIILMLEGDRDLEGLYKMSEETKRYSRNVQSEIQDIIDKYEY